MRAISCTRSVPSMGATWLKVAPPWACLLTKQCWSALAATCALGFNAFAATSINLSAYQVTGNYTLDANPGNGVSGLEASAVTFARDRGSLFIVGDEGLGVMEVSLTGQYLSGAKRIDNPHGYHIENVRISILQGDDQYHVHEHSFMPNPAKQATVGSEYLNISSPVVSGVFSRNSRLKDLLTFDLVDNKGTTEVISYLMQGDGVGFSLRFSQDERTQGYWQYLDGLKDNGSAYNVKLDIVPSRFQISHLAP